MINHHDGASLTHSMNCGAERCFAAEVTDSALMIGRVCADKAEGRLRCHRAAIAITRQGQRGGQGEDELIMPMATRFHFHPRHVATRHSQIRV